ncbi:hypothetical protein [Oceanobacillus luteolus]|uniref:Competence protein ComG n=1 Tax=Oceanobacillus luteolus TaxID=1274358 RepID=A0ABW4HXL7_9BACI|nr:hypothetical protein [Oceanobacillus luteolus]
MNEHSHFTMKPNGFFLIHVLFTISIIFIIISTSIIAYRNELFITDRQIEQNQIETLFQMARVKYIEEQRKSEEILRTARYTFPYGQVEITLGNATEHYRNLNFQIRLQSQQEFFSINHLISAEFFTP